MEMEGEKKSRNGTEKSEKNACMYGKNTNVSLSYPPKIK